jgi:D-alanyl-D-alanine carboxypeptidase (penicillin-binding protein 5/6)
MATPHEPSDGVSRLTELLRTAPDADAAPPRRRRPPIDPARRRARRRFRLIAGLVVAVVVVALLGSYAGFALTAPVGRADAVMHAPAVRTPAAVELALPAHGEWAVSVAGADGYLGAGASGIWKASGSSAAVPMASITKIVTALVILKARPLSSATDPGPRITFSKADHALYDKYYVQNATIAPMPTGSILSEHDALETMLVVSACNYAEALAGWAYGSQGAFLAATRAWLAAHGMTHTRVLEPTGLDPANTSTPGDLIALGRLAMANPAVASIVGKSSLDVAVDGLRGMGTTNDLLGTDGVNGIKTGTLDPSGSDLLYSAQLDVGTSAPLTVIGVELGGESRSEVDDDVQFLLESIRSGFHRVTLGTAGDVVGTYSTPWGSSARMVLASSRSVLTWSDTKVTASMTTTTLTTGRDGEKVGTVTWKVGGRTVSAPVVLQGGIRPPSAWWRLTHPFELGR